MNDCACQSDGCLNKATLMPKFLFPALGWPLAKHDPIAMIMTLKICDACFKALKVADFIGPEVSKIKGNIREVVGVLTEGKCPVDFDRVFIEGVPLTSKEGREYLAALAKNGKG